MYQEQTGPNTMVLFKKDSAILFSYGTPVVVVSGSMERGVAYITRTKYSNTTTKHVNRFLALHKLAARAYFLDQEVFNLRLAQA
jgi:hypothetical protein